MKKIPQNNSSCSGRIRKICLAAGGAALAASAAASIAFASYVTQIKGQTLKQALTWQKSHYDISWCSGLERKKYVITAWDGYQLHAELCRCPADGNRYVILSHGYTDNRYGNLKYMKIYLDRGYHCILYDLRGHGENQKTYCTYSCREAKDLQSVISDTRRRYGEGIILGLHGESLGAATTAAVMQYHPRVNFAVCDCGFAALKNVLLPGMKKAHLPRLLYYGASLVSRIRYGYSFSQMKPIAALSDCDVPMLFLHGGEDALISPEDSLRMSRAVKGYSEYHQIVGAGHVESVLKQPKRYRQLVNSFLNTIGC